MNFTLQYFHKLRPGTRDQPSYKVDHLSVSAANQSSPTDEQLRNGS